MYKTEGNPITICGKKGTTATPKCNKTNADTHKNAINRQALNNSESDNGVNKGNSSIPLFKTRKSMDKKQNRGNKLQLRETH